VTLFYFLILIVLLIPGVIAAVACFFAFSESMALALAADFIVNIIIAVIIVALCRNLLHTMELNI
ncbi:MAG: putative ABC exporter domain-containing protein, partial [Eubacterium sp.]